MRFRDSIFFPFALTIVVLGAITGGVMHLSVRGPVRAALERIELAPLEMVNEEAVRIVRDHWQELVDSGRGGDPAAVATTLRHALRAVDEFRASTRSDTYHIVVTDENGVVLSDPSRLVSQDAPPPRDGGRGNWSGRWKDGNGSDMLLRRSYFPPFRTYVYSAVYTGQASRQTDVLLRVIYLVGATGFTAMMAAFFLIGRSRIQKPLQELVERAQELAGADRLDDPPPPAPEGGIGELKVLGASFNRMVDRIRERQARLAELARYPEMTPNPIVKVGLDGSLRYANPSARALASALGMPPDRPERFLPPGIPALAASLKEAPGETLSLSHTVGGRVFEFTLFGVADEGAVIFHGVDVTSRKTMEEQLLQSQKMEVLGKTAGGMAHDFNNLLVGILGNASLLQERGIEDPAVRKTVDSIVGAAERGAQLTRQLLSFARHRTHERSVLSLNRLVEETEGILGSVLPPNVTLVADLDPDLPPVLGDASQLHQCVMNLCINARDAMPGGGTIRVTTAPFLLREERRRLLYSIPPGEYVSLVVADEGHGMSEATLGRIFEPFFSTKEESGTGLGMAMVYNIVKSHGGFIEVGSAPGKGTTAEILLPRSKDPLPEAPPLLPAGREREAKEGAGTVLLVDDEEFVRDVAEAMLSSLGFVVLTARNGREGVEIYRRERNRIDLVLMDLMMPVMDGRRAFEEIRRLDPSARVVISSGYSGEEDVEGLLSMGACAVLPKPYTFRSMSDAVRNLPPRA